MNEPLFLLPGDDHASLGRAARVGKVLRSRRAVHAAYRQHRRARWIIASSTALDLLASLEAHDTWHRALLLQETSASRRELLHAFFRVVVAPDDRVRILSKTELFDVMADGRAADLFIGGVVDHEDKALVLYRGNLETLVVPMRTFQQAHDGPRPSFEDFEVTDYGTTIRLGEYEAAADAILYELDGDARRRMRANEIQQDPTFGGSLKRLRLQKGISRGDFAPLNAKTLARIERGEVEAPHGETLNIIARRLGVAADQIATY